ncbi:MAG: metallophosphoesterase [Devosia sp.]|nr:metallophosphoesterase [Devosia sp.]MDP2782257.1 metallophosphoesterase [Devosia sp.]
MTAPRIARYAANTTGRDFVVGDIHGAYTMLLVAMRRVGFEPKVDRLFCTGDLIDRGPESARVAKFLSLPYVHSVRGNHEDMLIQLSEGGYIPTFGSEHFLVRQNGLGWWDAEPVELKLEILAAIRKLPLVIEIETPRGIVGLLHAEVPLGLSWQQFVAKADEQDSKVIESLLWGRERIQGGNTSGVPGVGRVFVGHTPQMNGVSRFGNVYAIDTGAIFADLWDKEGASLTMMNLLHRSEVLLAPQDGVLNLLDEPVAQPFGSYT